MNLRTDFDVRLIQRQGRQEIEYGIIHGDSTIVFMKAGLGGGCSGYGNKYLKIAEDLHARHGCSIIASSNPLGFKTDFEMEMDFIHDYAQRRMLADYEVYFFGHSNGAALGIVNAYKFPEIKKLVCINAPLMINSHLLIKGLKDFSGEKMHLVYGSEDPSFELLAPYRELESDKIKIICVQGADHNFTACTDLFDSLPGLLFFGNEPKQK